MVRLVINIKKHILQVVHISYTTETITPRQCSPRRPPPSIAATRTWYWGVVSRSRQHVAVRTRPVSGLIVKMGSPVVSWKAFFWMEYVTRALSPSKASSASLATTTATDRSTTTSKSHQFSNQPNGLYYVKGKERNTEYYTYSIFHTYQSVHSPALVQTLWRWGTPVRCH